MTVFIQKMRWQSCNFHFGFIKCNGKTYFELCLMMAERSSSLPTSNCSNNLCALTSNAATLLVCGVSDVVTVQKPLVTLLTSSSGSSCRTVNIAFNLITAWPSFSNGTPDNL